MTKTNGRKDIDVYLCIVIGIIFRVIMSIIHFTHVDDIGIANYILMLQQVTNGNEVELVKKFVTFWTYGPLQILFTQNLINENMSYPFIIFMGRLPSLICGAIFVCLIYKLLNRINSTSKSALLLAICIVSLSWENIIYSAQMEPYSMGLLFCTIVVYFVIFKFYEEWHTTIIATLLFSIGCYAQYQMFILVFSMYVVMFLGNLKNRKYLGKILFAGGINFVSAVPLLLFLWDTGKVSRGVNWNVGENGAFYFRNIIGENIVERLQSAGIFFLKNIVICFKYMFLANSFQYVANILTILLLLCAGLGIYYVHKNKEYLMFALFHDLTIVILLVMIIMGKLTFGPSRHILFIVPIWVLLIYFGIIQFTNCAKHKKIYDQMIRMCIGLIAVLFVFSIPKEIFSRKNLISEEYINNLINKFEPGIIYTEPNLNDLFLFDIYEYSNFSDATWTGWLQKSDINVRPKSGDSIILMSRNYTLDDFNITEKLRFEGILKYYNLDIEWGNFDRYSVAYKKEIQTNAEVEYAREYYRNYPNGLHVYVLKYE